MKFVTILFVCNGRTKTANPLRQSTYD